MNALNANVATSGLFHYLDCDRPALTESLPFQSFAKLKPWLLN
jgi:hypothetical protein